MEDKNWTDFFTPISYPIDTYCRCYMPDVFCVLSTPVSSIFYAYKYFVLRIRFGNFPNFSWEYICTICFILV